MELKVINPHFPALRSGHRLFQWLSPGKQFPSNNNLSSLSLMLSSLTSIAKPDLHTLFSLHVSARGSMTASRADAETVFSADEGITPMDLDRIRAEFL